MEKKMELHNILPDKKRTPSPTIVEIDEGSSKMPDDEEKVTLEEDHNVHFLDESHHEIKFLLNSHEHVVDMYENNVRILKNVVSAKKTDLDLNIEGTPCRASVSSTRTIKGEKGTEDQILHVVNMIQEASVARKKKKGNKKSRKRKKRKSTKRYKAISAAADYIQSVNDDWGDGTFSSNSKTLKYFSGSRVQLWNRVQVVQWFILVLFCLLAFFERPIWCASDEDFNLYHGTYKDEYYMDSTPDVSPRLLRAFDLTLLILLCVLYFVRVEIVCHQWYVEAMMLALGVLTALSGLILGGKKKEPAQILAFLRPLIFMISARPIRKYCQLCARSVEALSDVVPVLVVWAMFFGSIFSLFLEDLALEKYDESYNVNTTSWNGDWAAFSIYSNYGSFWRCFRMSLIFATKLWIPSRATAVLSENLWYQLVYDSAIMTGVALIWPLVLASVIRSYNTHSPAASQSARDESHREAFVNAFEALDRADGSSKGSVNKNLVLDMFQELFRREALHESASHMKTRKRYQIPRFDLRFVMLEELRRLGMNSNQTYLDVSLFMQLLSSPENFYLGTEKLKLSKSKLQRPRIKNLTIEKYYPALMPKAKRNLIEEIVSPSRSGSPSSVHNDTPLNWYQFGVRMWITHDEASYNGWDMHWSQSVWEPTIGVILFLNVLVPLIVGTNEWQDDYAALALTFDFIFGVDMFLRWLFRGTSGCQHIRDYVDFACFVIPALADIWAFLIWPHISDSDNTKAVIQLLVFIRLVRLVKLLLWVPQLRIMAQTFSHPALYHQIFIVLTTALLSTMLFAAAGMLWLGGVVHEDIYESDGVTHNTQFDRWCYNERAGEIYLECTKEYGDHKVYNFNTMARSVATLTVKAIKVFLWTEAWSRMTNDWFSVYLYVTIWLIAVPIFGLKMLSAVVFSKYWKEADLEKTQRNTVYRRSSKKMWTLGLSKASTLRETKNLLRSSSTEDEDEEDDDDENQSNGIGGNDNEDDGKVRELHGSDGSLLTFVCSFWFCRVIKSMYTTMMNDEWQIKKRKLDQLRKTFLRNRHRERHHRSISMRSAPKKPKPKPKMTHFEKTNVVVKHDSKRLWSKVRHLLPAIADAGVRTRYRPPWIHGGGYQRPYPTQDEQ